MIDKTLFESLPLNGLLCSVCGDPQRISPSGPTCSSGHGGAPSVEEEAGVNFQKPFIFCSPEDLCRHGRSMDAPCVDCTLDEEANPPTEEDTLIARLTHLLRGVADGLKGDPGPLKIHDWSDLPVLAKAVREERDENEGVIRVWRRRAEEAEAYLKVLVYAADQLRAHWATVPGRTRSPMTQNYDEVRDSIPNLPERKT